MSNAVQQTNPRTNPLAIVALVLGFVFPLLAIPAGHVARAQIVRTGERGDVPGRSCARLLRARRGSGCSRRRHRSHRVRHAP